MHVVLVYRGRYQLRQALDLEMLASVLRAGGHRTTLVYDSDTFGVTDNVLHVPWLARLLSSPEKIASTIATAGPDSVIFSVLPSTYAWARETANRLKMRLSRPVIFTSLHPSLVPERVMRDTFVDYVIQGEVEHVINPLLCALESHDDVAKIGNLWYRKDGKAQYTFRAELVNLDELPLPDKELFRPWVSHSYSYVTMVSRGCPYRCSFCEEACVKKLYGPRYFRRKGVDTVMRELVTGKERYRFREVIFKDSYVSGDKRWLRELMRAYRVHIGVPFKCFCTIDSFDEETAQLLKEGGCYSVEFGIQTWNERVRSQILHRRESNQDALQAFNLCAAHRIWYDIDHMFSLPGETEQDHADGALWYHKLRYLNRIKVHHLVYVPNADIVDYALQKKAVPDDVHARLEDGWETDFYDQSAGGREERTVVAGYAALYKLLPIVPGPLLRWLLKRHRTRWLRLIPSPLMVICQGLMAIRSRDLRFSAYVRSYPRKIWQAVREAARS